MLPRKCIKCNSATSQLSMSLGGDSQSLAAFNLAKLVTNHQPECKPDLTVTVLTFHHTAPTYPKFFQMLDTVSCFWKDYLCLYELWL